jgi:hypothetical protein
MNKRGRIALPRRQARDLARDNEHLRRELERKQRECHELEDANVNLRTERDAADVLLGSAMDEMLGRKP